MQSVEEILNLINSKLADFNDDEAIQAFNQLKDFIADNNSTAEEISDAYLLQGLLVAFNPFLTGCENDYSGMVYFHKAIQFNPDNISALLNIINCYLPIAPITPFIKQNPEIFIQAYDKLNDELFEQLDESNKRLLKQYAEYYNYLKSKGA